MDDDIETASALTMEKDPEIVTEEIAFKQDEEEVKEEEEEVTTVPEANIDATEEKDILYDSTTVVPEKKKYFDVVMEPTSTTENIYDEVRKTLSELFSKSPEDNEEEPTVASVTDDSSEEEVAKETTTPAPSTTTQSAIVEEKTPEAVDDVPTEIAHVVELPTEPEIKANVTEVNRTSSSSYVIATSTSQKVTHETEICYRGRCIKSLEKN